MSRSERRREKKSKEKEMKKFFKERDKEDFYFPFVPHFVSVSDLNFLEG